MLATYRIDFELVLDGDIPDLTDEIIENYFDGDMHKKSAATSCAYKHILCHEKMVSRNIDYALVLEDDIFLQKNSMPCLKGLSKNGLETKALGMSDLKQHV